MSKAVRKIIYDLAYNPVEEYWEKIKHKPLFQKIENLKREIFIIKKEKELDEVKLKAKGNELEELTKELNEVKATTGAINTSYKVYKVYKELIS